MELTKKINELDLRRTVRMLIVTRMRDRMSLLGTDTKKI